MLNRRVYSRIAALALVSFVLWSCSETSAPVPARESAPTSLGFEANALPFFGNDLSFAPLPTSVACTNGGGLEQMILPVGYVATLIASEPSFPDVPDMNTVNETGPSAGRFLYRTHETGSNSAVTVTDLETGITSQLARRSDWERFDGIVWTPWGTILAAEEAGGPVIADPAFPSAVKGLVYEIDPETGVSVARPAIGSRAHEGLRFDNEGNLYGISETSPGFIFKFVPDHKRDLSSGKLYALRIVQDAGDRTGWAEWVLLDRDQVRIDSDIAGALVNATGYNRPEDVEIETSTGNDRRGGSIMYVAVTGENRVLAIDLDAGNGPRRGQVLISDYVRAGVNAPTTFTFPDNLALDQDGNLFITEDPGGSAPSKTLGDDVWVARFSQGSPLQSTSVTRFLSITDCNAEPTGVYFSKSGRTLFVNIQHRGGDGRDGAFAIQKLEKVELNLVGAGSR